MPDDVVFEQLKLGPMENFSYVIGNRATGQAAITDPGFEADRLIEVAEDQGLEVTDVLVTHSHRDHVAQLDRVVGATGARVIGHPRAGVALDVAVEDGQELEVAGVPVRAVYTPGHCPDHVAFVVDQRFLLSGDALFIGECGRVDLPGSSVEDMFTTLMETIPSLDPGLEVYPGHDYGPEPHRSLATELEENYTLEKRDLEAFRAFMAEP